MLSSILAAVTQRPFWGERRIREFVTEPRIRELVRDKRDARIRDFYGATSDGTTPRPLSDLRAMLLFFSEQQQTWLVADPMLAYCVQDDRKWEEPKLELMVGRESMLPVEIKEDWSEHNGVILFGNRTRMWLYSKELFLNERPEEAVTRFLSFRPAGSSVSA